MFQRKGHIIQFVSFFLILLALIGSFTSGVRHVNELTPKEIATKSSSAKKATEGQEATIVQAVSFEAIVSFAHFNLSQEYYFNFTPIFSKLVLFVSYSIEEPLFILSYFKNTFCHLIAINAP